MVDFFSWGIFLWTTVLVDNQPITDSIQYIMDRIPNCNFIIKAMLNHLKLSTFYRCISADHQIFLMTTVELKIFPKTERKSELSNGN